jgi:hypothetical protein
MAVLAMAPGVVLAQDSWLGSYVAYLGPNDHFNSNGARLTQPWQIIRQDRANYHRFGVRDPGDAWDAYFGSANNRAAMEGLLQRGTIDPSIRNAIVNSNVWVEVSIYGYGNTLTYVEVWVSD